jgi:hypothetical protein
LDHRLVACSSIEISLTLEPMLVASCNVDMVAAQARTLELLTRSGERRSTGVLVEDLGTQGHRNPWHTVRRSALDGRCAEKSSGFKINRNAGFDP